MLKNILIVTSAVLVLNGASILRSSLLSPVNVVQAATATLKSTGVPQVVLNYMVANSIGADGKTLADNGFTADNITLADMATVTNLQISDSGNSNGIAKAFASDPSYNNTNVDAAWQNTVNMINGATNAKIVNLAGIFQGRIAYNGKSAVDMLGMVKLDKGTFTLATTGVPKLVLDYMIANSLEPDGKTLASHGLTANNMTATDMKNVDVLNISDVNNSNGIAKLIGGMSQNDIQSGAWYSIVQMIEADPTLRVLNLSGILQLRTSYPTGADMLGTIETAKYMPKLQSVNIASNNLGDGALTNYAMGQNFFSPSINTLDLSSNKITNMSGSSMSKLTGLRNWIISNNNLTTLPDGLNDPNSPLSKQLQSLVLDNNKFSTIPAWISTAAKNGLIILTATGNVLTAADTALLQKPSSLEYLNLLNQANTSGVGTDSYYIDNSGTTAIKTYNAIMNDPDLQVWLANDTNGALAGEIKALKSKIDSRADYQAVLNDYTGLLEEADLNANQASVTLIAKIMVGTTLNTVAINVKLTPYDTSKTEAELTSQALKQAQSLTDEQLATYGLKTSNLAKLTTDDVSLSMDSLKTPLTVGDINAFLDKYKDDPKYGSIAKLAGSADTAAGYAQLPPAPQPTDYAKDGETIPDYYSTEISVLTTQREQLVTTVVITTGKMDILADALEAAGDTEGAARIRAMADQLLGTLKDLPAANDSGAISDFFYMRSIVITSMDSINSDVKETVSNTDDVLSDAISTGKLTAEQVDAISVWKDANADAVAQGLVNAGKADSVDDVKTSAGDVADELAKNPDYVVIDKDGHEDTSKTITDTVTDSQTAAGNPPADTTKPTKPTDPITPTDPTTPSTDPVTPVDQGNIDIIAPGNWAFCLSNLTLGALDVKLTSGNLGFSVQDTRTNSKPYSVSVSMSDFTNTRDGSTIPDAQLQLLQPSLVKPVSGTTLANDANQINVTPNMTIPLLANNGTNGQHTDAVAFSGAQIYAPSSANVKAGEYSATVTWNIQNTPGDDIQ
ncbi:WxL domain-containing protein [Periweissella cryptocerci]|nr:WxL domain-containing protein [Periweissella cryptocerci]